MELKYFRLIKTIAEEGNMANSSEKLFLTQSALSHQLRELEERLGFKVFYRKRNHWTLTREGEKLHEMAIALFQTLDKGFHQIRELKEGAKGRIRMSAECQSFFHSLPAFVQKMGVLYPEIELNLQLGATQQTISQLLAGELDTALVTVKPESDQLDSTLVFEDELMVLMHEENPLSELPFLDAGHFADSCLFIHSYPLESVSVYEHFLKPNKVVPRKVEALPYTELTLKMIEANMGLYCVTKWALAPFKLSDELVMRPIGAKGLRRKHYLVVREEDRNKEHMANFKSSFLEEFG